MVVDREAGERGRARWPAVTMPSRGIRAAPMCAMGAIGSRLEARAFGIDNGRPGSVDDIDPLRRARLQERPSASERPLGLPVAEGFELDTVAHELRRHGRVVHLRPREFQLLATLAEYPGRAFTRRQLMGLAWGIDRDDSSRTVDVHIHWLRSKIEAEPARPTHLVTIRGFGYRLDPRPR